MKVLFYVQHLLGIGHLKRAATLARACAAAGLDVTVVSGGEPMAVLDRTGFDLVQLPPCARPTARFSGWWTIAAGRPMPLISTAAARCCWRRSTA
jgi:predicted glycosyltransferase